MMRLAVQLLQALVAIALVAKASGDARVAFLNEADTAVDVFWRNEADHSYSLLTTLQQGLKGALNTFKGHKFLIAERGKPVGFKDYPNYVHQRDGEQDIVIRGHAGNLVLHESDEGRKRAGLAPRRRNSNLTTTEVSVPTLKATLLLKNPLEEEVVVYWRSVDQDSYVKLASVGPGEERLMNTFKGHALLVDLEGRFVSPTYTEPNHEQTKDFEVKRVVKVSGGKIRLEAEEPSSKADISREDVQRVARMCKRDANCITNMLFRTRIGELQKQIQEKLDAREESEEKYRDYACMHFESMAPAPAKVYKWVWDPDNEGPQPADKTCTGEEEGKCKPSRRREMKIEKFFHSEKDDASISLVHNMVSPVECEAIKSRSEPRLTAAAVTGEAPGEKIISKSRKAKSTMVKPNHSDPTDVLKDLRERIFAFVNHRINETFTIPGQEPFNAIKYNVTGDEYRVHCDGYCDSSPYIAGGRAATVVIFCEAADRGGQTSFTNADVVLKGKPGQAAFFHYVDRKTGFMDSGWTKHGGCPVLEGTKYIATQWIRHGVSDQDPWYQYTPTGDRDFSDPREDAV